MNKTIRQALTEAVSRLKEEDIPTPQLDAELLLANILKRSREFVFSHPKQTINESQIKKYESTIERRCLAEPIAYITGRKEFYGLKFFVDKSTLIPRPETELIVDEAISLLRSMFRNKLVVVDVGTGSGNIITSVAKNFQAESSDEHVLFFGIDPSTRALEVAKKNAQKHNISEKVEFLRGRFLNPLIESPQFNIQDSSILVLANLPYLSEYIYNSSPGSVKNFEPKDALLSGDDGFDHYRKLLNQIKMLSAERCSSIAAILEFSPEQKPLIVREVKSILPNAKINLKKDLAVKWRVAIIEAQ